MRLLLMIALACALLVTSSAKDKLSSLSTSFTVKADDKDDALAAQDKSERQDPAPDTSIWNGVSGLFAKVHKLVKDAWKKAEDMLSKSLADSNLHCFNETTTKDGVTMIVRTCNGTGADGKSSVVHQSVVITGHSSSSSSSGSNPKKSAASSSADGKSPPGKL